MMDYFKVFFGLACFMYIALTTFFFQNTFRSFVGLFKGKSSAREAI